MKDFSSISKAFITLVVAAGVAVLIDALFRRSSLMRAKWDERHGHLTYGQRTILTALRRW